MASGSGEVLPAPVPQHRELTREEADALAASAYAHEQRIKDTLHAVNRSTWELAEALYQFHEAGLWRPLGYDTLEEFLAQPDIGMKRTLFFRMTRVWRDLVVTRRVPPGELADVDISKADVVRPAIMAGNVEPEQALSDAATLGRRDLTEKYAKDPNAKLEAGDEPERKQCPNCGTWVEAAVLE